MKDTGITLLELIICILIISILIYIVNTFFSGAIRSEQTKNTANSVKQILLEARSVAKRRSEEITASFLASKVKILDTRGSQIEELNFEDNVKYCPSESSIVDNKVIFNYLGSPLGSDGTSNTFSTQNNRITVCFFNKNTEKYSNSRALRVLPITGLVETEQ